MDYDYEDNLKRNRTGEDGRPWQGEDDDEAHAAVVLRCVFGHLSAKQLWRCGAVCMAWRRASLDDALWRRLLLPDGTPQVLRSLRRTQTLNENLFPFRWREEYYRTVVRWRRARLEITGSHSAPLLCVSLHSSSLYLALLDEDARLTVWEDTNEYKNDSRWAVRRSGTVSPSWSLATQTQWAPHARRLLLTGRLALTDRSELLVLEFNEHWMERTVCRIACGSSGGCWVDDESFLALQLRLLAPGVACTTVWLTAASQEIQSEHAGVTTPLMRIYNEASTQITHASVTPISTDGCTSSVSELDVGIDRISRPTASYYRALRPSRADSESSSRWLVGACGVAGGARGEARAVSAWSLPRALCLPRVSVREALSERVRRHRQRAARPLEPEQPPDEDSVRTLCTPPSAVCDLSAQIFGMTFHPRGGCVWVTTAAGATCLSLPALRPLLQVPREVTLDEPSLPPHYVVPSTDDEYFVSPVGRGSPLVSVWSVMSAGRGPLLAHESPALAALLLPTFDDVRALLVLTTEALFAGRGLSEARRGSGGGSCEPPEAVPCPPCVPAPQPACRPPPPSVGPRGLKQVCCAPSVGRRPPCAPPTPTCPKTCRDSIDRNTNVSNCGFFGCEHERHERCGDSLDRVARRLAASELARRLDYEREVAERKPAPEYEPVAYKLAGERQCLRATDGCDYTVSGEQKTRPRCGPGRVTPPPCPLDLDLADNCQINRGQYSDPCAYRPRVFVEIDRSQNSLSEDTCNNFKSNSNNENPDRTDGLRRDSSAESLTTRNIDTIKGGGSGCPRKTCKRSCSSTGAQYVGDKRWCVSLPPPAATPRQCKEPSLAERLRRRSGGTCSEPCGSRRRLHSKTCTEKSIETKTDNNISPSKSDSDRLDTLLLERTQLKETGLGRVMLPQKQIKETKSLGTGVIELKIPPNSDSVRVHVSLNFDKTESSIRGERSTSEFECTRNLSSSANDSSGSWLSIKNLQKKITGCRLDDRDRKSEKSADLGTSKPKPKCDKEAGPRGETPTCPAPRDTLTQRKPPPPCPPAMKRSIKTDLINTIHL